MSVKNIRNNMQGVINISTINPNASLTYFEFRSDRDCMGRSK